jgi:hypothetical protein
MSRMSRAFHMLHNGLVRQGPGSDASTQRAIDHLIDARQGDGVSPRGSFLNLIPSTSARIALKAVLQL